MPKEIRCEKCGTGEKKAYPVGEETRGGLKREKVVFLCNNPLCEDHRDNYFKD